MKHAFGFAETLEQLSEKQPQWLADIQAMQELFRLEPAAFEQALAQGSLPERMERIQTQAQVHGLTVGHDALAACLQHAVTNQVSTELSDADLADVSGGVIEALPDFQTSSALDASRATLDAYMRQTKL